MTCPNCSGIQHCPGECCKDRNQYKIVWIWVSGNGPISCGYCGFTMSVDDWMHHDIEQAKKEGMWLV